MTLQKQEGHQGPMPCFLSRSPTKEPVLFGEMAGSGAGAGNTHIQREAGGLCSARK